MENIKSKEIKFQEIRISKDLNDSHMFKVVVVGDTAVGKSNLLSRYVKNEFNRESKSTVGVELSTKVYQINETLVKVNIWDTAGQERYQSITAAYYKGAKGAFIVYDTTRIETFESIDKWYNEIKSLSDKNIVMMIVGNKSDLKLLRQVSYEEAISKAESLSKDFHNLDIPFLETSALQSINIEEAFKKLIMEIYIQTIKSNLNRKKNDNEMEREKSIVFSTIDEGIKLNKEVEETQSKCKC
jgi:Ras-related protein Rab-11A